MHSTYRRTVSRIKGSTRDYKILDNGDLLITYDDTDSIDLVDDWTLTLEPLLCNGLHDIYPEMIGALTDAPILTDVCPDYVNSTLTDDDANIWWYPNYAVTSPMEELKNTGQVIFKNASN